MYAFDTKVLTTTDGGVIYGVFAVMFLYGPASAGFAYCLSFGFRSPVLITVILVIIGFLVGMGGPVTVFMLRLVIGDFDDADNSVKGLVRAVNIITWTLRFTPSFCLGKGLFNAINLSTIRELENDEKLSVWTEPVLLLEVWFLAFQSIGFLVLAVTIDILSTNPNVAGVWSKMMNLVMLRGVRQRSLVIGATVEDADVIAEEERVASEAAGSDDAIVLNKLTKIYDNGKVAVNNMSLGIAPGECFGLLGSNGKFS